MLYLSPPGCIILQNLNIREVVLLKSRLVALFWICQFTAFFLLVYSSTPKILFSPLLFLDNKNFSYILMYSFS